MPNKIQIRFVSRRIFVVALLGIILATGSSQVIAKNKTPSDFIQDLGAQAVIVLQFNDKHLGAREAAFRKLLASKFDLTLLGRFSLGRYWRRASAEQRSAYLKLFNEYVLQTYASKLGGYTGEKLIIDSETPLSNKTDFYVKSRIRRPGGPPIKTTWRVRVKKDEMRIIDILVEGISMAMIQRDQFGAVISRNGFDGLLEVLRARTDKMPAAGAPK